MIKLAMWYARAHPNVKILSTALWLLTLILIIHLICTFLDPGIFRKILCGLMGAIYANLTSHLLQKAREEIHGEKAWKEIESHKRYDK